MDPNKTVCVLVVLPVVPTPGADGEDLILGKWGYHRQGSCQAGLGAAIAEVKYSITINLFYLDTDYYLNPNSWGGGYTMHSKSSITQKMQLDATLNIFWKSLVV